MKLNDRRILTFVQTFALFACAGPGLVSLPSALGQQMPAADHHSDLATVKVGTTPGLAISPTFMGLSHEWDFEPYMGQARTGANAAYRQLLQNLMAYGSGPLNLRIGGDSTDATTSATSAEAWGELAKALGVHFELGVNMGANDPRLAAEQAKRYLSQMPAGSIDAIEIGNEPDHYHKNGKRAPTYTDADYVAEFARWRDAVMPVLPPGLKLMGPAWGGPYKLTRSELFEDPYSNAVGIFSYHFYAEAPKPVPPDDIMLTPAASTQGPSQMASTVEMVHAHGGKFRVGEMNSIWNAGVAGISDAFSSALWAIDINFEFAKTGADGVNWICGGHNFYTAFNFSRGTSNGRSEFKLEAVHPLYYGLLFFQAATGKNPRFLPVDLSTEANLKAWATVDGAGTPHVVLLNKDTTRSGPVRIEMPGYRRATLLRLTAPSYRSTSGVSFAGLSFDGSADGRPHRVAGQSDVERVDGAAGVFLVPMPAASAVLVTFTK